MSVVDLPSHRTSAELGKLGIAAVAHGVWRVALPFTSPLVYSFAYVIRVDAGFIAVDLGWNSDESWALFQAGLRRAGGSLDELVGVVATHAHPDHYGLAHRVRENSSAWIAMHPGEHPQIAPTLEGRQARFDAIGEWLQLCGAPASELGRLDDDKPEFMATVPDTLPDFDLLDGAVVPGSGGRLVAIHTPGHTPGHLCFEHREAGLLFTGDHVLPRITPNVSKRPTSDDDPLRDYEASVGLLGSSAARLVLPGHEWPFDRLDDRLASLQQHHQARLDEVHSVVRAGAQTVWEVAEGVTWSRAFASLNPRATRSAIGETYAHLERLTTLGRLRSIGTAPRRWADAR